jgi:hypothetical protein
MAMYRGALAGLALGIAITGGTLALGATAASADDPDTGRQVASRAVKRDVPTLRGIPFLPIARQEEKEKEEDEQEQEIGQTNCVGVGTDLGLPPLADDFCVNAAVDLAEEPKEEE